MHGPGGGTWVSPPTEIPTMLGPGGGTWVSAPTGIPTMHGPGGGTLVGPPPREVPAIHGQWDGIQRPFFGTGKAHNHDNPSKLLIELGGHTLPLLELTGMDL